MSNRTSLPSLGRLSRRTVLGGIGALTGGITLGLGRHGTAAADPASSLDELRQRWQRLLTGGELDLSDPDLAAAVNRVDVAANKVLATLQLDPDRTLLWPDLNDPTRSNHVTTAFKRIRQIALAWATPGTSTAADAEVAATLLAALDWMRANRYSPELPRYDNDWDWEIGSASALVDTLVLLHPALTPELLATYTSAVRHYTPDPNLWRVDRQIATGANRVWICTVVAIRAILDQDDSALLRVRDAISDAEGGGANSVVAFNDDAVEGEGTGEGFYSDGSFLQHWKHPYNGGYGKELLGTLSSLLSLMGDSSWQVHDPELGNVYRWVHEAFDPLMVRGDLMASVCGREIARASKQGHAPAQTVIEATLRLIDAAPADQREQLVALTKQWITEDTYRNFLEVTSPPSLVAAQRVLASPVAARGPLVGSRIYPRMDKLVHHRPDFAVGLSCYSRRIYNYESIQNENLHGWHTSDGMVLLFNGDLGHYSGDYWPTVDPYRLPGTTVDAVRLTDSFGFRQTSDADWVGGVSIPVAEQGSASTVAAYGMDLRGLGSDLRALKSWFLIDDAVICLGSGISGTTDATVETIIENRKLRDARAEFVVDGEPVVADPGWEGQLRKIGWCHLEGTGGYVFPRRTTIHAKREDRSATWRDINIKYGTDDVITRPYLTTWIDHGPAPNNAGYAYVQLPTASAAETSKWYRSRPIMLVARSSVVHAVMALDASVTAANFFGPGRVDHLASDGAASVVVGAAHDPDEVVVALSDPTQLRDEITVDIDRPRLSPIAVDEGVTVTGQSRGWRITATTGDRHGAAAMVRFST